MVFSLAIAFTVLCGLLLLMSMFLVAGLNDVGYVQIDADAPMRLTQVLPRGLILLALAVLPQVGAWRVIKAVRLRQG